MFVYECVQAYLCECNSRAFPPLNFSGLFVYERQAARVHLHPQVHVLVHASIVCLSECLVADLQDTFFSEAEPSTFT